MPSTSPGYRVALRVGTALAPALGVFSPRIRKATEARREAGDRLLDWARWHRDRSRPLVWFHAASVGEGLQAQSVLTALQSRRSDCQIVYTHFSPSAEEFARGLAVEAVDYLPYDLPDPVERLLAALEPDLLVFAKLDLWAELSTRAVTHGADVALVAATVRPGSGRLRWPVRRLLTPGYRAVTAAAAVASEDAVRLQRLGVAPDRIHIVGDPRFDSVSDRVRRVQRSDPLLEWGAGAPTLVAGSTWPLDELVVLQAFRLVRQQHAEARLIVVPHEPTVEHLSRLEQMVLGLGLPAAVRLSQAQSAVPLLVADRVGALATLYGAGTMAYVGGGFGTAGLHSVLEPAAWGIPVAFGPRWRQSRDAGLLLEAGAAVALPARKGSAPGRALSSQWKRWIADDGARREQGSRAASVVEDGRGASDRTAALLDQLISQRRPRRSPPAAPAARR